MTKILIVDDSNFIRTIMKTILTEGGYTDLVEASNGQEAIDQCEAESPDLILLDIIMPDMNGLEALKKLASKTKVCMVTAVGQESTMDEAKGLGAIDYVTKPFDKDKVLETVKKILG